LRTFNKVTFLAALVVLALAAPRAHSQVRSSANFQMIVDGINAGGGAAGSASFRLRGSIGQPFSARAMASASYAGNTGLQAITPAPYLNIAPAALAFGNQALGGTSGALGVTLANMGNVPIDLSAIGLGGAHPGDFGQSNACGPSLAIGASCAVSVLFTPTQVGARSAQLDIASSAPQNAPGAGLSGTGVGVPEIELSATAIGFGAQRVGVAGAPQSATVSNVGSATLAIGALTISGAAAADFVLQPGCSAPGSVPVSGNCLLSVVFTPSAPGARFATLTVGSDDSDEAMVPISLSGTGIARARHDFNGDGRSDIVWRHAASGENYLYTMNGTAIGADEGYLRTVADQNWAMAAVGDFDGDGRADILWRHAASGENYVYLMNGALIAGEGYIRQVADPNWVVAGVGDFDGDGRDDILWRNLASGENYLYPMNGAAIGAGEGYVRTVADHRWQVAGVGDFNGDGKSDIVWRNTATGENYVYLMDGIAIAAEGYLRSVLDQNWQVAGTGDFDGDGRHDLLWRNRASGENYLYRMQGAEIVGEGYLRTVADLGWQVAALGDYDGDGKTDVLWRNAASGDNYLYPMDGFAIKETEGYTRNVADQNWQPQRISAFAVRRGPVDGAQVPTASGATGTTLVRMDLWTRRVAGRIDHTATETNAFIAHIHTGARGVDGGPIVFFEPASGPGTAWTIVPDGTMPSEHYLNFLNGTTYVNVHTDTFPGGEIRGQLE
jgi:hypothetical protein